MRKPAAFLIIAAAGVAAAHGLTTLQQPQPAGTVLPRGVSETSLGEPTAVAPEGVSVVRDRNPDGKPVATIVIGWDRVREVTGPLATEASKFTSTAEKAWRARARLERGDWVAAEPLFEELFSEYRTRTGPTALTVAGGLVRCRLMRGAQTAAVEPWIAWLRAQPTAGAGVDSPPESVGQQVSKMIDPGTGLIPPASQARRRFARLPSSRCTSSPRKRTRAGRAACPNGAARRRTRACGWCTTS